MGSRPCDCGSNLERSALNDGYGIFLCYVCGKCREQKLSRYRPDILGRYRCDEPIEAED